MTPRDFCFWLAGILKMSKDDSPTDKLIREQLDEVIKRQRANETYAVNVPQVYPATLDEQLQHEKKTLGEPVQWSSGMPWPYKKLPGLM